MCVFKISQLHSVTVYKETGNHTTHDNGMENFYLSSSFKKKSPVPFIPDCVGIYFSLADSPLPVAEYFEHTLRL